MLRSQEITESYPKALLQGGSALYTPARVPDDFLRFELGPQP